MLATIIIALIAEFTICAIAQSTCPPCPPSPPGPIGCSVDINGIVHSMSFLTTQEYHVHTPAMGINSAYDFCVQFCGAVVAPVASCESSTACQVWDSDQGKSLGSSSGFTFVERSATTITYYSASPAKLSIDVTCSDFDGKLTYIGESAGQQGALYSFYLNSTQVCQIFDFHRKYPSAHYAHYIPGK